MDSARYGIIGAFVTNQFIKKGEEVFSNYGYGYATILGKSENSKRMWYYDLWKKFKEENPDQSILIKNFEDANREFFKIISK